MEPDDVLVLHWEIVENDEGKEKDDREQAIHKVNKRAHFITS
jgi:hypothetical protein